MKNQNLKSLKANKWFGLIKLKMEIINNRIRQIKKQFNR